MLEFCEYILPCWNLVTYVMISWNLIECKWSLIPVGIWINGLVWATDSNLRSCQLITQVNYSLGLPIYSGTHCFCLFCYKLKFQWLHINDNQHVKLPTIILSIIISQWGYLSIPTCLWDLNQSHTLPLVAAC
jgi:hypothetical protein